ncbi:MAG: GcrA family cell cycle regulator [Phenylobacterium sp.]|uniref:GcrA family cell cycle regulator n=1 Tax=Phenylobacterium sp. TaxID=1871053 RepID=UPI00391DC401
MSSSPSWTRERVDALARLWRGGLSAAQIAAALGGVTRNAVIGKIHRLGLNGGPKAARPGTRRASPVRRSDGGRRGPAPVRPPPPRIVAAPEDPGLATVLTVAAHACRWPIGDPLAAGFTLCGRPAARGAYCDGHAAQAYQPQRPRDHLLKMAGLA